MSQLPFLGSGLSGVICLKGLETKVLKLVANICQWLRFREWWHMCYILIDPGLESLSKFLLALRLF